MLPRPFTGCSAITLPGDARKVYDSVLPNAARMAACGVLVNTQTLNQQQERETIYPDITKLHDLFTDHANGLNVVKYTSNYPEWTKATELWYELGEILHYGGQFLHAIQFNFLPEPTLIHALKKSTSVRYNFVLISDAEMRKNGSPQQLARHLSETYRRDIDGVVFDCNSSKLSVIERYVRLFNDSAWDLPYDVILSGVFHADNLDEVAGIMRSHPQTSLDSLCGLLEEDRFSVPKACRFVRAMEIRFGNGSGPDPTRSRPPKSAKMVAA